MADHRRRDRVGAGGVDRGLEQIEHTAVDNDCGVFAEDGGFLAEQGEAVRPWR